MTDGTCAFIECVRPTTVQRRVIDGETILGYCDEHDPLKDDDVSAVWEPAGGDAD